LPEHLTRHLVTMGELHRAGRYDRLADGVERVTGRAAMSVRDFVTLHPDECGSPGYLTAAGSADLTVPSSADVIAASSADLTAA
jgi:hypothetical protein